MKYFIDTEFHEHVAMAYMRKEVPTIDLISIGIVAEDGREFYAVSNEFDLNRAWENAWLRDNVLYPIYDELKANYSTFEPVGHPKVTFKALLTDFGKSNKQIATDIMAFIGDDTPEFYGYYADYDWVVFCWLFGRMMDLPKGFPMYCIDLKQMMDAKGLTKEWKKQHCPDPENEHNALADARWNKQLFEKINQHK